jgi:hypothetical protein
MAVVTLLLSSLCQEELGDSRRAKEDRNGQAFVCSWARLGGPWPSFAPTKLRQCTVPSTYSGHKLITLEVNSLEAVGSILYYLGFSYLVKMLELLLILRQDYKMLHFIVNTKYCVCHTL